MGRKRNGPELIATIGILIGLAFYLIKYHGTINIDVTVGNNLFSLLPSFIAVIACLFITATTTGVSRFGGSVGTGISLCFMFSNLDTLGLFVGFLSDLTLAQVQIWTMIISVLFGAVLYAATQ